MKCMNPDDMLFGQIALHLKLMSRAQLSKVIALQQQQQAPKAIGAVCVELGYLSDDKVQLVLRHQAAVKKKRSASGSALTGGASPQPAGVRGAGVQPTRPSEPAGRDSSAASVVRGAPVGAPPRAHGSTHGNPVTPPRASSHAASQAAVSGSPAAVSAPLHSAQGGGSMPAPMVHGGGGPSAQIQGAPMSSQVAPPPAVVPPPSAPAPTEEPEEARSVLASYPRTTGPLTPEPGLVKILEEARQRACSDVHVMAQRPLSFRKEGKLTQEGEPMDPDTVERMVLSVMTDPRRQQLEQEGYADFTVELDHLGRFRANVGRQSTGLKGCFRLIMSEIPELAALGLPSELERVAQYHQGLAVVAGPNGQGKTTTLAALVNIINNSRPYHIITVEDPVEVTYPISKAVMSQREVMTHTKSFHRALKGALREDPDVIVIGELRDAETVEIALEAAETGHLVVATMSTRSGAKTIDRLIDMFPPDRQAPVRSTLAGALKMIISQRLVPSKEDRMVPVIEMLTGNIQLWNLIRDQKLIQLPSLMQRGLSLGMIRVDDSLKKLVLEGIITEEVAFEYAEDVRQLKQELRVAAGPAPQAMAGPPPQRGNSGTDAARFAVAAASSKRVPEKRDISSRLGGFLRKRK